MRTLYGIGLLTFALLSVRAEPREPELPVTVVVVRHTEKAPTGGDDPELSAAGQERARALARLFSEAGVTHLFATEFVRTRTTLAPLATALSLEVEVVPAGALEDQLATIGGLPPGSLAIVAGHSNTVPRLVAGLGGEIPKLTEHPRYGTMLADDEYDRLFLVTLPAGDRTAVRTLELRYGD